MSLGAEGRQARIPLFKASQARFHYESAQGVESLGPGHVRCMPFSLCPGWSENNSPSAADHMLGSTLLRASKRSLSTAGLSLSSMTTNLLVEGLNIK